MGIGRSVATRFSLAVALVVAVVFANRPTSHESTNPDQVAIDTVLAGVVASEPNATSSHGERSDEPAGAHIGPPTLANPLAEGLLTDAGAGAMQPVETATVAASSNMAPQSTSTTDGQTIAWRDEFNEFDADRWRVEHSTYGDGNNELQCYRPENVTVNKGRLVLRALNETYTCPNGSRRQYTSGMVRSTGVTFAPGQAIEFRVKLTPSDPSDQAGLWPAVWASGWAGGWPRGGELDFFEAMTAVNPKRSIFSMHFATPGGGHGVLNKPVMGDHNFSADWHTVRFHYGQDATLVWFLDGVEVFEVHSANTIQGYPAPFDQEISEIKINLALGGRPGPLAPGALGSTGATFEIDYIRVFDL